jgi:hypothetical protein
MGRAFSTHEMRKILTFWLKKPKENRKIISLCKDGWLNTKINLNRNRMGVVWIHLVHDRKSAADTCQHGQNVWVP